MKDNNQVFGVCARCGNNGYVRPQWAFPRGLITLFQKEYYCSSCQGTLKVCNWIFFGLFLLALDVAVVAVILHARNNGSSTFLSKLDFLGQKDNSSKELVTVVLNFNKDYTFEIKGTEIKDVKLVEMVKVLKDYKAKHPLADYECVSNFMLTDQSVEKFKVIFGSSGIELKNFWVAVNTSAPSSGPYGPGFADVLKK